MTMRAWMNRCALFAVIFGTAYAVCFILLCRLERKGRPLIHLFSNTLVWKGGASWQKFQEFDPAGHYDVVVLGSSHAYRGYDPGIFARHGYRMFNLGTSGQTMMNSYFILADLLDRTSMGSIILDIYEVGLEDDGLESTADLVQNITSDRAAVGMVRAIGDPRGLNMLGMRWLRRNDGPEYRDSTYVSGGFSRTYRSAPEKSARAAPPPLHVREVQLSYLRKIITLCHHRRVPLVLTNHYYPHRSDRSRHMAYNAVIRREIGATAVRYHDFAFHHDLDDRRHFFDHNHLNQAGVEIFNEELIATLERDGSIARGTPR